MSACNAGDPGSIPGFGRSPGEETATHSNILACRIPWREEPGRLKSTGSQRGRKESDTSELLHFHFLIYKMGMLMAPSS